MIKIDDKALCCGCEACANICPQKCIILKKDEEGFFYPIIDSSKCINCHLCDKVCPIKTKKVVTSKQPLTYAGYCNDENNRQKSSSGGVFGEIALQVLQQNGIVYGATFFENYRMVQHTFITDEIQLSKLQGSKYIQSRIGNSYKEAKIYLDSGKIVLFSGTPCQIEGLYSFLGKEYKNLITVDVICHGVPSEKIWNHYIDFREKENGARIKKIELRHKITGWKKYSTSCEFLNNKKYEMIHYNDPFMKAFMANICLRPSCTKCEFKKINHVSDITLGDFWGVEKYYPELFDDKGTSLVLVHTSKGKEIFHQVKEKGIFKKVDLDKAILENTALIQSVSAHPKRVKFMREVNSEEFDKVVNKYVKAKLSIKEKIAKYLNKMGIWNIILYVKGK